MHELTGLAATQPLEMSPGLLFALRIKPGLTEDNMPVKYTLNVEKFVDISCSISEADESTMVSEILDMVRSSIEPDVLTMTEWYTFLNAARSACSLLGQRSRRAHGNNLFVSLRRYGQLMYDADFRYFLSNGDISVYSHNSLEDHEIIASVVAKNNVIDTGLILATYNQPGNQNRLCAPTGWEYFYNYYHYK